MLSPLSLAPPAPPATPRVACLTVEVVAPTRLAAPPLGVAQVGWVDPDGTLWIGLGRAASWVVGPAAEQHAEAGYAAVDRCLAHLQGLAGEARGVRAFGSLAFDPLHPVDPYGARVPLAAFAVPRWLVRVPAGQVAEGGTVTAWVACGPDEPADQLGREEAALRAWAAHAGPRTVVPRALLVPDDADRVDYEQAVRHAVEAIRAGRLAKVALARPRFVEAAGHLPPWEMFLRLAQRAPGTSRFLLVAPEGDAFLGASPECLVRVDGRSVFADALAGTAARDADPAVDAARAEALRTSPKDLHEHALVRDAIVAILGARTTSLEASEVPGLMPLPNVWHLHTPVRGTLAPGHTFGELVRALHPTPAVGGTPRELALPLIAELERSGRGCYAAPVGWLGADAASLAVGIRSAHLRGNRAVAMAGAGIVAASDPSSEWLETERKLAPMLETLTGGVT